ncbi:MAG: peptide chain release factor 1, partial [Anaerolineales bacterium]
MLDKLAGVEARYEELNHLMADGAGGDYGKIAEYAKERASLEELVAAAREYRALLKDLEGARALLD